MFALSFLQNITLICMFCPQVVALANQKLLDLNPVSSYSSLYVHISLSPSSNLDEALSNDIHCGLIMITVTQNGFLVCLEMLIFFVPRVAASFILVSPFPC